MSYQRKRSSDGTIETAGCLVALLGFVSIFMGKRFYEQFRYKPSSYQPIAPHVANEAKMPYRNKSYIIWSMVAAVGCGVAFLGSLNDHSSRGASSSPLYLFFTIGSACIAWYYYNQYQRMRFDVSGISSTPLFPQQPRVYSIYPAKDAVDLTSASNLVRSLLQNHPNLAFQIITDKEAIVWQVVDPSGTITPQGFIELIRSHVADARVVEEKPSNSNPDRVYRQSIFFGLANEYAAPICFVDTLKTNDPLIALTRRMDFLNPADGERVLYSLITLTTTEAAKQRAQERLKEGNIAPLAAVPDTSLRETNLHGLDDHLLERKLSGTFYHAFLVVTIESQRPNRVSELSAIASDVTRFGIASHNHLQVVKQSPVQPFHSSSQVAVVDVYKDLFSDWNSQTAVWRGALLVLTPDELASLWHLPDNRYTAEHIAWTGAPIPDTVIAEGKDRILLGTTAGRGTNQNVYLTLQDRAFHTAIIGKTGTGKSTLLHTLIHQDIAAGRGIVVLDPHGKLIDDILNSSIPQNRASQVIRLELGDSSHPVPLNPFRIPEKASRETAFNLIYWVFRKLYESIWRDRMDYVFRNVIQTLLTDAEATPRDISRILLNIDYRSDVIGKLDESEYSLQEFWRWYEAQNKSEQMEIASPILTRTSAFLGNKTLELMTCHPESLDYVDLIRSNKIVLVNLSGSAIQSESGTLGAILLSQIFIAAQHLGYIPDGALPRSYVYVDEVERIVTTPLPEMFATARKFGLSLILANQYMKQLSSETLEGILGNVGTQLVFEVGESDSRSLAKVFEPELSRDTLMKLGTYHMAVKTRSQGKSLSPFVVKTLPLPKRNKGQGKATIAPSSRMTQAQVSAWLTKRYKVEPPKKAASAVSNDGLSDYD